MQEVKLKNQQLKLHLMMKVKLGLVKLKMHLKVKNLNQLLAKLENLGPQKIN